MKKLKYLIILMFSILIITSCGEITQPCNHVKSDWIIDKEATCIVEGKQHIECTLCHKTLENETIKKLDHKLEDIIEHKDPTCINEGYDKGTCTNCHEEIKVNIKALGHDLIHHEGLDATCTKPGYKAYDTCSRCNYTTYEELPITEHIYSQIWEMDEINHYHLCKCGDKKDLEEHNYKWVIDKKPTTEVEGLKHEECKVCGYEKNNGTIIPKLEHNHNIEHIPYKESTCTVDGNKEYYYCTICEKYYLDEELTEEVTIEEVIIIASHTPSELQYDDEDYCLDHQIGHIICTKCGETLYDFGHNYQVETKMPTCNENGYTKYICSVCNKTKTIIIEKLDHIVGESKVTNHPTCSKEGIESTYCLMCNAVISTTTIEKLSHSYESKIVNDKIVYTCQVCGDTKEEQHTKSYTIIFDTNGGNTIKPMVVQPNSKIDLPTPIKDGFVFSGWYLDENFDIKYEQEELTQDITLYALWENEIIYSETDTNTILRDVETNFTFQIETGVILDNTNVQNFIKVLDLYDNSVAIKVRNDGNKKYTIYSDNYQSGMTYSVEVDETIKLVDCEGNTFWFTTKGKEQKVIKYSSSTKLVNQNEVYGSIEQGEVVCIILYHDLLNPKDQAVIYENDIYNIIVVFEVVSEGKYDDKYIYEIKEANADEVFDECNLYYSENILLDGIELEENVEEIYQEALENSESYRNLKQAAKRVSGQIGKYYYDFNGIKVKKPKITSDGAKLILNTSITIEFARMDVETRKVESLITLDYQITSTISWGLEKTFDSYKNFSLAIVTSFDLDTNLTINSNKKVSSKKELDYFQELVINEINKNEHEEFENTELEQSKTIKLARIPFGSFATNLIINLSAQFDFSFLGELGAKTHFNTTSKIGVKNNKGNFKLINSVKTSGSVEAYLVGKVSASVTLKADVDMSVVGVLHGYINVGIKPYFNTAGIVSFQKTLRGASSFSADGYVELGVKVNASIGISAKIKVLKLKKLKLRLVDKVIFDKSWSIGNKDYKIVLVGSKIVYLYYNTANEEYNLKLNCGSVLNLNNFVDNVIKYQDLEKMKVDAKKINSSYLLLTENNEVQLTKDGKLTITNPSQDSYTLKVKVSKNKISKYIYLNITIKHNEVESKEIPSTCTATGMTSYTYCSGCNKILSGQKKTIPTISHNPSNWIIDQNPTCTKDGLRHTECTMCHKTLNTKTIQKLDHTLVHHEGFDATCTKPGYKPYDTCSRCNYTTYEEIPATGHNYVAGVCTKCGEKTDKPEYIIDGDYIYFGEYPQTLKEESVTIISTTPDSNGYYLGSDNERYAKVVAKPYSLPYYFNNKQKIVSGTTYYFKLEPIKWKILQVNGTEYKLVTDLIIDNQKFYSSRDTRTIDGKTIYANNYEHSDIRKWLNEDFYNKAFSKKLQAYINITLVDNSLASTGDSKNIYICNDTYDKVYLLSYKDVTNEEYGFTNDKSRQKQLTDYAKALGCYMDIGVDYYNNGVFWLRSPYNNVNSYARCVGRTGGFNSSSSGVNYGNKGISVAITITLNEHTHNIEHIQYKESTCTVDGNKAYYYCTLCEKYYLDEELTQEVTSENIIIKALGHNIVHHERVNPTCTISGHTEYDTCTRCDYTTYLGENLISHHNWIQGKCTICNETINKVYEKEGQKYIYFGEYPQTLKDENVTIISTTPDSNGYYLGSDGERYAKVVAKPYHSNSIKTVYFNNFKQIVNGATYYFKVEPIKWKVLLNSGKVYQLIADVVLDFRIFSCYEDARKVNGKTIYPSNYEYSDIRKWLNEDFYNKAFTKVLQSYINTTLVDNSVSSMTSDVNEYENFRKYEGNNVYDKVYLLSAMDIINSAYGFSEYYYINYEQTKKYLTDYSKALGNYIRIDAEYNIGDYWLRTPDIIDDWSSCTWQSGLGSFDLCGVVPAITITIK